MTNANPHQVLSPLPACTRSGRRRVVRGLSEPGNGTSSGGSWRRSRTGLFWEHLELTGSTRFFCLQRLRPKRPTGPFLERLRISGPNPSTGPTLSTGLTPSTGPTPSTGLSMEGLRISGPTRSTGLLLSAGPFFERFRLFERTPSTGPFSERLRISEPKPF